MIGVHHYHGEVSLRAQNITENDVLIDIMQHVPGARYDPPRWWIPEAQITLFENLRIANQKKSGAEFLYSQEFIKWEQEYKANRPIAINCEILDSTIDTSEETFAKINNPINEACRYFFKAAVNQKAYANGNWDGYVEMYNKTKHNFPSGLLYLVKAKLDEMHMPYTVSTSYEALPPRQFPWKWNENNKAGIVADPDQDEAVRLSVENLRGILKAPTGFGKTAILMVKIVGAFGVPVLFLANKKALLDDARDAFLDFLVGVNPEDVDQIKDGVFGKTKLKPEMTAKNIPPLNSRIIVATIQSIDARLKDPRTKKQMKEWLENVCKLLLVDECQAVGTPTWDHVLDKCLAPLRFTFSATPKRTDGASLKINAQSGPAIFTTSAGEQIDKGRLCELDIKYIPFNHGLYNEKDTSIEYAEAYTEWIVNNQLRNELIVEHTLRMVNDGRFVLVLITRIEHGFILKNMFVEQGIPEDDVRYIYGETADAARVMAIKEFRKGKFKILIGSTIFDAGVNIPSISGVVIGSAGNSEITLVQRIGRGARNVDYEKEIGYLPEFMLEAARKVTEVIDVLDEHVKFFAQQATNRFYTAREEFEKSRVKVVGGMAARARRKSRDTIKLENQIDQHSAQVAILKEFFGNAERVKTEARNDAQQNIFSAFAKK